MKQKAILTLVLLYLSTTIYPQSFFRSVADIDSFAYVTMDSKILVLKRDLSNNLVFKNSVPFLSNHKPDKYNSSIIINNYLIATSLDSVVLFSILDRDTPVELFRLWADSLNLVEKFGNYLLLFTGYQPTKSTLIKIENDSLKTVKSFVGGYHFWWGAGSFLSTYDYANNYAYSFPHFYKKLSDSVEIYKYNEGINEINKIGKILPINDFEKINLIVANATNVFVYQYRPRYEPPFGFISTEYKYTKFGDSLINPAHFGSFSCAIPAIEFWGINAQFGRIKYPEQAVINLYNVNNNLQYNYNISQEFPSNYLMIKNSIYRIGQNGFWYLHDINANNLTFVEFVLLAIPQTPLLIYPINNQQVYPDTVTLQWHTSSPNITSYTVNVSKDSLFTNMIDTTIADTTFTLVDLELDQKYYWRVRAKNILGWSNYSNSESFTATTTGIKEEIKNKINFLLNQNYPNPFNPSTIISYSIPQNSFVTLKVYDVLGNEVSTLVNETKSAGRYDVRFDASGLSNGVYFYTIKADNFNSTKKMIFMK